MTARRANRVDGNHAEIVKALRDYGCSVQSLAEIGNGCPDLVVGHRGINYLLELKDPAQVPSARKLTAQQYKWHAEWKGKAHLVETVAQALAVLGITYYEPQKQK